MFQGEEDLRRALSQLGERLRFGNAQPTAILVSGGAALNVLGLVRRTTKDIDIVALIRSAEGHLDYYRAEPLPAYLRDAIRQTAIDLGISEDWINPGPTSLVDFGLPEKCLERALRVEFGDHLTVYFAGRVDQIYFKLYAAADQGGGRHLTDLLALDPTPDELLRAARWSLTHDPSEGYRMILERLLIRLGRPDVASQL